MKQLTASIYRHTDTCHVYVIRQGDEAVLIDFGDGSILERLSEIGVRRVTDILMTHHHRDQAQGLWRAAALGARLWVPHAEQDLFHSVDFHWAGREIRNSYNNREDRFSLLEPVPVAGTLRDYDRVRFGGLEVTVIPTPGHTTGSISLFVEIDGRRVAFVGDLIYAPGKLWSLAATQWSYNGGEGIAGTILSLLDLKERGAELLLPSHGEPIAEAGPAVDLTVERLSRLLALRRQNPRLFRLRETPYKAITPHLLWNRTSMANSYVLLSRSGKALLIDFGYDFAFGVAAGADRASRRPWLYTLPALKRQFGVARVDVVVPTHYHDDHVAGFNLLRQVEGTRVWAPELFADILERPHWYDLPCLWYDPIPVDRRLPLEVPVCWEEYELVFYHLPGHTNYAVAVAFEVDGQRVVAAGDRWAERGGRFLNYVYKNDFDPGDYRRTAALLQRLRPDLILSGHWEPLWVKEGLLDDLLARGEELERLHHELLPAGFGFGAGIGRPLARVRPYEIEAAPGTPVPVVVEFRNPFDRPETAAVRLAARRGWLVEPVPGRGAVSPEGALRFQLDAGERAEAAFRITAPEGAAGRRPIAADLTVGSTRFGQCAEAVVVLKRRGELR